MISNPRPNSYLSLTLIPPSRRKKRDVRMGHPQHLRAELMARGRSRNTDSFIRALYPWLLDRDQKKAVSRGLRVSLLGECCYAALLRWEIIDPSVTAHVCRCRHRHCAATRRRGMIRRLGRNGHHHRRSGDLHHHSLEPKNVHHRRNSALEPDVRRRCNCRDCRGRNLHHTNRRRKVLHRTSAA